MSNKPRYAFFAIAAFIVASTSGRARAGDELDGVAQPAAVTVEKSADSGSFLNLTHGASVKGQSAFVVSSGGYDSARSSGIFEATAEVNVWGPVAIRGGAVYSGDNQRVRPSFGARVQTLRESRHGIDSTIGVFYRPEGLTEAEGEIEAVVSVGRHIGKTALIGNLVYGQDPEARERDAEVRLAALRSVAAHLLLGLDGRLRFDLGSTARAGRAPEPTLDALVGPAATVVLGRVALVLHSGGSALKRSGVTNYGAFVLGGFGTAF